MHHVYYELFNKIVIKDCDSIDQSLADGKAKYLNWY